MTETTLPRPKSTKKPTTEKVPPVVDPRDAGREREVTDAVDYCEGRRIAYQDDQAEVADIWHAAFRIVIVFDRGRCPPSLSPLVNPIQDLAEFLDSVLSQPETDFTSERIEPGLCPKLEPIVAAVEKITAPPEPFDMKSWVQDRLNEPVELHRIEKQTGIAVAEIRKFKADPDSVDWAGRELPNTIENREKQLAEARKFNCGKGLSLYSNKFIAAGFGAEPE